MLNYPNLLVISDDQLTELCLQIAWAGVTNRDSKVTFKPIQLNYISRGQAGSYDVDMTAPNARRAEIVEYASRIKRTFYSYLHQDVENGPAQAEQYLKRQIGFRNRWVKEIRQRFLEVRMNQNMVDQELTRRLATAETIKFYSEVALITLSIFPTGSTVLISYAGRAIVSGGGKVLVARLVMPIGYGLLAKYMDPRESWGKADAVAVASNTAKSVPGMMTETAPGSYINNQVSICQEAVAEGQKNSRALNEASRLRDLRAMNNPQLSPKARFDFVWKNAENSRQVQRTITTGIRESSAKGSAFSTVGKVLGHPVTQGGLGALSVYFWRQSLIESSNAYLEKLKLN